MLDPDHPKFKIGNVVFWKDRLYVVAASGYGPKFEQELIPMNASDIISYPTATWPSEKDGVESIQFVAETVYGWILQNIKRTLGIIEPLN